jgi:hypothetical protein
MRVAKFSLRTTVALAVLVVAGSVMAQSAPVRLRGTISAIDGKTVTIATREGTSVDVKLSDKWSVMLVSPISASDIKEGIFVGVASVGSGGRQTALEVLVFPEAARGAGEGHYPWDLRPDSMMTNAEVASVVSNDGGQTLTLAYKDKQGAGRQTIEVKPGTPIVTFSPGSQADATVGAKVFMGAQKAADGTFSANRLLVGKDGLTPPM